MNKIAMIVIGLMVSCGAMAQTTVAPGEQNPQGNHERFKQMHERRVEARQEHKDNMQERHENREEHKDNMKERHDNRKERREEMRNRFEQKKQSSTQ